VLVISHDPALNPDLTRGPDGRFLERRGPVIRELSYAELQRYDVGRLKPGTDYAKRQPQQQAVDGARIPRLSDLFALVRKSGNEQVRFAIETKASGRPSTATWMPRRSGRRRHWGCRCWRGRSTARATSHR
jgi:glycerophosphoryl diester phosphodiesterase